MTRILTPVSDAARAETASHAEALCLDMSLAEAWPWPGMVVRAAVRLDGRLLRLRKLAPDGDGFVLDGRKLRVDPIDALVVRSMRGLPSPDGIAFRAVGERFAPLLALLRRASPNIRLQQTERLAACRVLGRFPTPSLVLQSAADEVSLTAHPAFYCDGDEGFVDLGLPVHRTQGWWTFEHAVAPSPDDVEALRSPVMKKVFERGVATYNGEAALEIIRAAAEAGPELDLRMSPELGELVTARPAKPVIEVTPARSAAGEDPRVEVTLLFEADTPYRKDKPVRVSAEDVLAAAGRGGSVLRAGTACLRVDPRTVDRARRAVAALAKPNGSPDTYVAEDDQIPELLEWARQQEATADSPWNVYVSEAVEGAHRVSDQPAELRLRLDVDEEDNGWFTVDADFRAQGKALSPEEVRRLLRLRKKWVRKGKAWYKVDPKALARFDALAEGGNLRAMGGHRYGFRAEAREKIGELFSLAGSVEHSEKYKLFLERLESFERVEAAPMPKGLKITLRPYQAQGYYWLRFLSQYGLNGILADEMGLGKTAQTLAMLASLREEIGPWPNLIICPTSLVDNWAKEARRFTPDLRVLRYSGSPARRDRLRKQISERDLVLTTYATARNDAALLKQEQWRFVILDEAHTIKNAAAATTKAVKAIPSKHRLALTGTPVQNRLDELWSLFDFLMPGFLGRYAHFSRRYEEAIVKGQSPVAGKDERAAGNEAAEDLRRRIRPFVLRRLKTEVATDLPPKIIQDVPCRLTADQVELYKRFTKSDQARNAVKELEAKGAGRAQADILAALTHLRKICNHPDLMHQAEARSMRKGVKLTPMPGYEERSGKLSALDALLTQCRDGGHRALIFCQQTSMLDILEHFLESSGSKYLRLDGSTPGTGRQALVDKFNEDDSILCFLISTRAGGSGLNLVGADTVIFYDHDWNPANDCQAQDRAYRIGQTRVVNVYRLVSQGTMEEKILDRQARKMQLARSVVQTTEAGFRDLTSDELVSLFKFTPPSAS